jgi:hypothetical protein
VSASANKPWSNFVWQANVLIDDRENAVLSDFGLSTIVADFSGTSYMTTSLARGGALR